MSHQLREAILRSYIPPLQKQARAENWEFQMSTQWKTHLCKQSLSILLSWQVDRCLTSMRDMSFITSYSRDQIPLSPIPPLQSAEVQASVDWHLWQGERRIRTHIPCDYPFLFTSCWTVKFRRHGLCRSHLCVRKHIQPCADRTISVCFSSHPSCGVC